MATRFEHRNIRAHGTTKLSGRIYTVRCCQCSATDILEVTKATADTDLKREFQRRGWLIAKTAQHDLCPTHVGVEPANQLAAVFKTTRDGQAVKAADEIAATVQRERHAQQGATAAVLDKHFPPPKKPPQEPAMTANVVHVETGLSLEQTLQLTRALDGIAQSVAQLAGQMGEISAAMELMAQEQAQTRAAIAQIVPTMTRTSEGVAGRLDEGFARLHTALEALRPAAHEELRQEISRVAESIMTAPLEAIPNAAVPATPSKRANAKKAPSPKTATRAAKGKGARQAASDQERRL
jgi:hypothetical protein